MKHNFTEKEEEKTRNVGSLIEGIVWVIIMATVLIGICCSCTSKDQYEYGSSTDKVTQQKITLKKIQVSYGLQVTVHKETGVVYINTYEGGITPLYNSDGSLYVLK